MITASDVLKAPFRAIMIIGIGVLVLISLVVELFHSTFEWAMKSKPVKCPACKQLMTPHYHDRYTCPDEACKFNK